jgi:signal transduction histidine kinase
VSAPGAGRVATGITRDGVPLAMILHDAAVLDDPALVEQVAAGAALAVSNARLQARTRERVDELIASRGRLVEAGDAQRRRFGRELDETIQTRLAHVAELVGGLDGTTDLPCTLVQEMVRDVEATRSELDDVARGLLPSALSVGGLASALPSLATRLAGSAELSVEVTTDRLPPRVEATVYYVCAEAIANAAKHAAASRISVAVAAAADGSVVATVVDDGVGGAIVARGTGLLGLVDRVDAVGGRLTVDSPPGGGTRVSASIPL